MMIGYPVNIWLCPWCKLLAWYGEIKKEQRHHYSLFLTIRQAGETALDECSDQIAVMAEKDKGKDFPLIIQAGKLRRFELEILKMLNFR